MVRAMRRIPPLDPAPSDEEVALRAWRESDVPAIAAACRDGDIQRWTMVPDDYTEDHAAAFVAYTEESREAGTSLELAVVEAADEAALLGAVGLVGIDWDREQAEIGYWTATGARRRGVAARAVGVLPGWAFAELGLSRLQLMPYAANEASARVADRAGYTREGVLRSYYKSKRGLVDVVMYSLLRGEL
jgi:RimJ/RimL family protein N-acetyltransferase